MPRWRARLGDWIAGRELSALRVRVDQGERAVTRALDSEQVARDAARRTQGRLAELRRANVTRDRQVRAVHLAETLLDRFRERGTVPGIAVATVDAVTLATWHSMADELARPAADREPDQPSIVHPPTDSDSTSSSRPCGDFVVECDVMDCGGCGCHIHPPCTHCVEHGCTRPELHDGDHEHDPDPAVADA